MNRIPERKIPVGRYFPHPSRRAQGPPASYTMGTGTFFRGVKRGVNHPPPTSAEVKERIELYLYPPLGLHGKLWGEIYHFSHREACTQNIPLEGEGLTLRMYMFGFKNGFIRVRS